MNRRTDGQTDGVNTCDFFPSQSGERAYKNVVIVILCCSVYVSNRQFGHMDGPQLRLMPGTLRAEA